MNMPVVPRKELGAVAIGRNEGERLKVCLQSLGEAAAVIYVDSGSTDGSVEWAHNRGYDVVKLDMTKPFTAARARNAGFDRLQALYPDICFVQFIDGDCELALGWSAAALSFLHAVPGVAGVSGRLRERDVDRSIYNWLCQKEWEGPIGEVKAVGGIVMLRCTALREAGGFRDDLIAGEEPELCVRLRAIGWRIWRLDQEMATHDANMTHFVQWWRRMQRGGYAFAEGAHLHGQPPERHWVWESRRAWIWGLCLPLCCAASAVALPTWGWVTFGIYPLQVLRQILRKSGPLNDRLVLAVFQALARFPEAIGQIRFQFDRLLHRSGRIIEYK